MGPWLKADGSLDLDALDNLAASVKAVTDSNASIDAVIKAARIGAPKVIAFRCTHSGMFMPSDYAKEWGTKYGHGLGTQVVSESLNSQYFVEPSQPERAKNLVQLMHPVEVSQAQMDYVVIDAEEYKANRLVPAIDDSDLNIRIPLLYKKQLAKKGSRLSLLSAQFSMAKGPVTE